MGRSLLQKLKPYYIRKALRYLKHYGPKDFLIRVRERLAPEDVPYGPWYEAHRPSAQELERQRAQYLEEYVPGKNASDKETPDKENPDKKSSDKNDGIENVLSQMSPDGPLFSIVVPAWHTPERYLRELLDSVLDQSFGDLELVIANASPQDEKMAAILEERAKRDERLRVIALEENQGIAGNTNEAIRKALGQFVCFMDHDDLIAPDALYEAWRAIESKDIDLLYTDEDKIRDDAKGCLEHFQPHFKPGFNLDLLRSNNYICHFLMVRRSLIEEAGGLDGGFEGAQDYEFLLRLIDRIAPDRIHRIPRVLYHWRTHEQSTADNPDSKTYAYESGKRALEEHLARRGVKGEVMQTKDHGFYRVRYELTQRPLVSVIIPNREEKDMLERCMTAIRKNTRYENYEVIIVENNSSSGEILDYYKKLRQSEEAKIVRWKNSGDGPSFNFAAINNYGVQFARGEYLVFLNNDVEVGEGWLSELLPLCERDDVAAAGAKLVFPDGRIQSAGIVLGIGGIAGSLFTGMNADFSGYMHKASLLQDLSAVTAAMMIVKKSAFLKAGGFDEDLAVAFNDVDLCLRLAQDGLLVVYDPFAGGFHHESVSRGDEYTKDKAQRYRKEAARMKEKWAEVYENGDPYYNPNFSLERWDYTLSLKP